MAITIQPKYPAPDRSKQKIQHKKDEDGILDVGWCEGVMSDGRPFRAEMWAQDGVSMLTVFFSAGDLEDAEPAKISALIVSEKLVTYRPGAAQYCTPLLIADDSGNQMWSANIVVGDEDETFVGESVPIFSHGQSSSPASMFKTALI